MEFNRNKDFTENKASKVDLNSLIAKVKQEEKKNKKTKYCNLSSSTICCCGFWYNSNPIIYLLIFFKNTAQKSLNIEVVVFTTSPWDKTGLTASWLVKR